MIYRSILADIIIIIIKYGNAKDVFWNSVHQRLVTSLFLNCKMFCPVHFLVATVKNKTI